MKEEKVQEPVPYYSEPPSEYKDWPKEKQKEWDTWTKETNQTQKEMRECLRKMPYLFGFKKLEDVPEHMLKEP